MPSPVTPPFDYMVVQSTGQSLCCGNIGTPAISTTQPFSNIGLTDLTTTWNTANQAALTAATLVAQWRGTGSSSWGNNINGEDPATTCINGLTAMLIFNRYKASVGVNSLIGVTGTAMAGITKGGGSPGYAAGICEAQAAKRIATALSKACGVIAILLTHGEQDASSSTYAADVKQLYDFNATDLLTATSQVTVPPLFLAQQATTPTVAGGGGAPVSATQQLLAHTSWPGLTILVGPKYQLECGGNTQHLTAVGYRHLGEIYLRALWTKVFLGQTWEPVRPTAFVVSGSTVTMTFTVPVGSLVWDTAFTAPHASGTLALWANGKGFEAHDVTGNLTINSVVIQGGNQVVLTLSAPPSTGLSIAYAYTADSLATGTGGTFMARGGLLRDQAAFLTTTDLSPVTGSKLPNWCVTFNQTGLT